MKRTCAFATLSIFVTLIFISCSSPTQETATPTLEYSIPVVTNTPAPSPTPIENTATPAPTKTPELRGRSYYNDLPPGEYLTYLSIESDFEIISLDASYKGVLYEYLSEDLSHDGKRVISRETLAGQNAIVIFDLVKDEYIAEHIVPECFFYYTWSPDEKSFAGRCGNDNSIFVYQAETETMLRLTNWIEPGADGPSYGKPSWSPDGKWIAYFYNSFSLPFPDHTNGVYVTNTSCLQNPDSCFDQTQGPLMPLEDGYKLVWSPDSRYMSIISTSGVDKILVYDLVTNELFTAVEGIDRLNDLTWSYDSTRIFFGQYDDIYVYRLGDQEPELIKADFGYVMSYVEIPEP